MIAFLDRCLVAQGQVLIIIFNTLTTQVNIPFIFRQLHYVSFLRKKTTKYPDRIHIIFRKLPVGNIKNLFRQYYISFPRKKIL